jgi:protein arginine N-methyltransferase 3
MSAIPSVETYPESSSGSETSDILDLKNDEGWQDVEPDEEEQQVISLLDDRAFSDVESMLSYCKEQHNFDFLSLRQSLNLDFYGTIKLVNFIRSEVKAGHPVSQSVSASDFEDQKYLQPVLDDDAFLFNLDDLPAPQAGTEADASGSLIARIAELEEELKRSQLQFSDYRDTVKKTLDERWNDKSLSGPSGSSDSPAEKRDDDTHYFSSYSYNGMLFTFRRIMPWPRLDMAFVVDGVDI